MAPLELEYGAYWEDNNGNSGFLNEKIKLPVTIRAGRRIKRTYRVGDVTLKLDARCDKKDKGGNVSYKAKWSYGFLESVSENRAISVGPGQDDGVIFDDDSEIGSPKFGFQVRHVASSLLKLEEELAKKAE